MRFKVIATAFAAVWLPIILAGPTRADNHVPVVSNVTASQRTDGSRLVDIYYNLADADGDPCTVSVQASDDGGANWAVPITAVSGAVGPGITPGMNKHIVWDCAVDLPGAFGSQYKVRVCANDGYSGLLQWSTTTGFTRGTAQIWAGAVSATGNCIYFVGRNLSKIGYVNPAGGILSWINAPSQSYDDPAIAVRNSYIYCVGGEYTTAVKYAVVNGDGTIGSWQPTASLSRPAARAPLVVHGQFTYSIGGTSASYTWPNNVQVAPIYADGSLGSWSLSASLLNHAHPMSAAVVHDGYLYVFGGGEHSYLTAAVERCQINADGSLGPWVLDRPLPAGRNSHGAVLVGDKVYILGGSLGTYGSNPTNTVISARISADHTLQEWEVESSLPYTPTSHRHAATMVNDWIYALGNSEPVAVFYASTECDESPAFTIDNRPGTDLDLFVQSVEMSQAIQDGTVPMVADRSTFLRATVGWTGSQSQVTGVDARLTVTADGNPVAGSPFNSLNGPITAPLLPDLENEDDTLNFRFIVPQSEDVDLTVELNPPGSGRVPETNYANNTYSLLNQAFECRRAMTIRYVPIDYQFGQPPGSPPNLPDVGMIAPGTGESFVRAIYPSPSSLYASAPSARWDFDINALGQDVCYLLGLELRRFLMSPRPDFVYAWLPASAFTNWYGTSRRGGRAAFGTDDPDRHQRTFAHELGHNFGLWHPPGYSHNGDPSGDEYIGVVGVDVEDLLGLGRIKRSSLYGIMVPGVSTSEAWVDPASYQFFLDADVLDCGVKRTGEPVLLITGLFDPVAVTVALAAANEFSEGELTAPEPTGNLILRAYNLEGGEHLIYELPFAAVGVDCPDEDTCIAPIVVAIPLMPDSPPEQVDRIDMLLAATSQVLAQQWRSQSPPQIAIVVPSPGDALLDGMEITWTGTDPDGDTVHYGLAYSWDDGVSWTPVVADTTNTSAILDADLLPGSDTGQARLRLTGTDDLNTVSLEVGNLTLDAKKPPVVDISTPSAGAIEFEGAPVVLAASVSDPEDGQLPAGSITWYSNVDGFLGTGTSLLAGALSLGVHELLVTATDSDQMVGTDTVAIEVLARPPGSAPGDFDHDGFVAFSDFENMVRCFAGPDTPVMGSCLDFSPDLDGDSDVDLSDFVVFQILFNPSP